MNLMHIKRIEFLTAFPSSHIAERSSLHLCYGEEMSSTKIIGSRKSASSKGYAKI